MGRRCHEILDGRDVFGNRFCYPGCPVRATLREQGQVRDFDLNVCAAGGRLDARVTVQRIPSAGEDLFTVVHVLEPITTRSRGRFAPGRRRGARPEPSALASLTPREREVLCDVAAGRSNKYVAEHLGIRVATVRNHVHHILVKLGVHSKLEATSLALRQGFRTRRSPGS